MFSCREKMNNKHIEGCFNAEVLMSGKKFSWLKLLRRAIKFPERRFYFWLRVCQLASCRKNYLINKLTRKIHRNLNRKYATDIALEATIGPGLKIGHFTGVVIRADCIIGKNFTILQNTTIGAKHQNDMTNDGKIIIGDNVFIGAIVALLEILKLVTM